MAFFENAVERGAARAVACRFALERLLVIARPAKPWGDVAIARDPADPDRLDKAWAAADPARVFR
jgi:hypothetical protein